MDSPTIQDLVTNFISGVGPVCSLQQSFLRIHLETRRANAQANRIKGNLPQKTAGNSKPATGRTDRSESETTARRPDTTAWSDSTTTRGYASATAPPPPQKKQQGNTPQTRPARMSGPPHSSWKQTDTLPGPRQTGPSTFL